MAVIDLKNENKIIIIQNDIQHEEKVLTHPNNEPIFRQNGYEPNGLKSSFALAFESVNSEWLNLNQVFTLSNDGDFVEFDVTFPSTTFSVVNTLISDETSGNYLSVLTNGLLFIFTTSGNTLSTLSITQLNNTIKITRTDTGLDVTLNGITETSTLTTDFSLSQMFKQFSSFSSCQLRGLRLLGNEYNLTEGLGNTTNGATINTSHADGIKRINFGQWLKGNDIDGWNPYTIV